MNYHERIIDSLNSISKSVELLSQSNDIVPMVLEFMLSILSVFLGAYLAYRFALKQLRKQEELNQKSKVKWISCQESWIPLCELSENLIEIFNSESMSEFVFRNDWKQDHFVETRTGLQSVEETQSYCISMLFAYLKASKRGQISPVIDEIEEIKKIVTDFNIDAEKCLKQTFKVIDEFVLTELNCGINGDLDCVSYTEENTLSNKFYNSLINSSAFGSWRDYIRGVTYGNSEEPYSYLSFDTNEWESLEKINSGYNEMGDFPPEVQESIYGTGKLDDLSKEIDSIVCKQIMDFTSNNLSSKQIKDSILEKLRTIQRTMYDKIDSEYRFIKE